ncbi:MAG: efflux RND transporter periplasmic adaptor subunit [Vicinamibacterales bacterium]
MPLTRRPWWIPMCGLLLSVSCRGAATKAPDPSAEAPAIAVATATVAEQPLARRLQVSGTLMADEQADVGAEAQGRVVATPVERGTRVETGQVLIRLAPDDADAQVREADANVGQIRARLGLTGEGGFEPEQVAEVRNAKAALDLATAEFERIASLRDQKVVSTSEFDQRRAQVEAARQQYQVALNGARQSYESLKAAEARLALARNAQDDTTVRAPFAGLVVERRVSVGDYVNRGTVVVTVVRVDPLRLELSVPEQHIGLVQAGQTVAFTVDAFPGRQFEGRVRFVSPSLRTDQRALIVEALVPNRDAVLKPGLFATAALEQSTAPALVVPTGAVQSTAGVNRVFVVKGDRVEERIVTTGYRTDAIVEILSGVERGETIAVTNLSQLADGTRVRVDRPAL